jgi:hypothetical protein
MSPIRRRLPPDVDTFVQSTVRIASGYIDASAQIRSCRTDERTRVMRRRIKLTLAVATAAIVGLQAGKL